MLRQLPGGIVITEASVLTDIGVRVPDVVWGSAAFARRHGESPPYPEAPEICVEIVSRSNSDEEIRAYLGAGAQEVWIAAEDGGIRYFGDGGKREASRFPLAITLPQALAGSQGRT